jgi:hypothetical protein
LNGKSACPSSQSRLGRYTSKWKQYAITTIETSLCSHGNVQPVNLHGLIGKAIESQITICSECGENVRIWEEKQKP